MANYRRINIPCGESHWKTKLTWGHVREIRKRCQCGEKQIAVGMKFGLSQPQVSLIVRGHSWKNA